MSFASQRALFHSWKKEALPLVTKPQRRWARVHDVRFVVTRPQSEVVFDKYKHKLERKAQELGVKDIKDLRQIYQDQNRVQTPVETQSRKPVPPPPTAQGAAFASPQLPQSTSSPSSPPGVRSLSAFIDLPKFRALPAKEIATLWRLRHASSPRSLCATIPYQVYRKIEATARRHPQFVLPLARSPCSDSEQSNEGQTNGADIHFLQWTFPTPESATVLFTHLTEYKMRGEFSLPHTTVTHHLELAQDKGLVLLQGQVADDRGMSVEDARALLLTLQKFYAIEDQRPERGRLLDQFSRGDSAFRVEDLVEEAEKIW